MTKEEQIKLFRDAFPEVINALEEYAHSEGYVGIAKYLDDEVEQIIKFCKENFNPLERI